MIMPKADCLEKCLSQLKEMLVGSLLESELPEVGVAAVVIIFVSLELRRRHVAFWPSPSWRI